MISSSLGKIDLKQELDEDVQETLDEMGIYLNDLHEISGKRLHDFMISHTAYTDGERLIFFDVRHDARAKFIYYMGAERDAELATLWKDVAVYEGDFGSRLNRFIPDEDENLADDDQGEDNEAGNGG